MAARKPGPARWNVASAVYTMDELRDAFNDGPDELNWLVLTSVWGSGELDNGEYAESGNGDPGLFKHSAGIGPQEVYAGGFVVMVQKGGCAEFRNLPVESREDLAWLGAAAERQLSMFGQVLGTIAEAGRTAALYQELEARP